MKTFRVSNEDGETYTFKARDLNEAKKIARENDGGRFTVYEETNGKWRWN